MSFLCSICDNCQSYLSCNSPVVADYYNPEVISRDIQDRIFIAKSDPGVVVKDVAPGQLHIYLYSLLVNKDTRQAECPDTGLRSLAWRGVAFSTSHNQN